MRNLVVGWTDELEAVVSFNSESALLVGHILNCRADIATQWDLRSRSEEMLGYVRCREEKEALEMKVTLLERQVGELTAGRDEATIALRHA